MQKWIQQRKRFSIRMLSIHLDLHENDRKSSITSVYSLSSNLKNFAAFMETKRNSNAIWKCSVIGTSPNVVEALRFLSVRFVWRSSLPCCCVSSLVGSLLFPHLWQIFPLSVKDCCFQRLSYRCGGDLCVVRKAGHCLLDTVSILLNDSMVITKF